jgi:hypothetical protein
MAKKGSNGKQEGEESVALVEDWIRKREDLRDWSKYAYSGRINRSALAVELGVAKSVMDQNPTVKALLKTKDKLWFESDGRSIAAAQERTDKRTEDVSATNSHLTTRIAELEVEVRELRKQVAKFKSLEALVQGGFPGLRP